MLPGQKSCSREVSAARTRRVQALNTTGGRRKEGGGGGGSRKNKIKNNLRFDFPLVKERERARVSWTLWKETSGYFLSETIDDI